MKVGLLTSHSSMNIGGLLQAYCLKRQIMELGYECDIVPYVPTHHDLKKHPIKYIFQRKRWLTRSFFVITHFRSFRKRSKLFKSFKKAYLVVDEQACDYSSLPLRIREYKCVCVGSDQLWNLNKKDNDNGAYYLNFKHDDLNVFSYAVSFGDGLLKCPEKIQGMLPCLDSFLRISVRDEKSQEFLSNNGHQSTLCLDPTLLPDRAFWDQFPKNKGKHDYILIYGFENAYQNYRDLVSVALKISKETGLPVFNAIMDEKLTKNGFVERFDVGPVEFLGLLRGASYVITNSFHGTIFSIVNKVPFFVVADSEKGLDGRKETLLRQTNLMDRVLTNNSDVSRILDSKVDFDASWNLLKPLRESSIDYLRNCLMEAFKSHEQH